MVTWPKNYGKPSNTTVTRKNITVIRLFEKFDHCSSLVRSCAWCVVSLVWWPRPRADHLILRGRDVTVTGSEFPTLFLGVLKGNHPYIAAKVTATLKPHMWYAICMLRPCIGAGWPTGSNAERLVPIKSNWCPAAPCFSCTTVFCLPDQGEVCLTGPPTHLPGNRNRNSKLGYFGFYLNTSSTQNTRWKYQRA